MYRPELEIFTSDILDMISEKKLLVVGSSCSSNTKWKMNLFIKSNNIIIHQNEDSKRTFSMFITQR